MSDSDNQLAIAVAQLQTSLANISTQLTQIASQLVKLEEGKASAITQREHDQKIQNLEIRVAQIMTIGSIATIVVPIILNALTKELTK